MTTELRQQRLLTLAWAATIAPLLVFGWLSYRLFTLQRDVNGLETKKADLQRRWTEATSDVDAKKNELATLERALATKQAELTEKEQQVATANQSAMHYREFAGIRIQFYRDEDRQVLQSALQSKGYKIETGQGSAKLLDAKANSIAFGANVAHQDVIDIATALVEKGFPLRQIAPATRQRDPNLIQIYASASAAENCGALSVEDVKAGKTCGAKP